MILFNWSKIYDMAQGNIFTCNLIMEMLILQKLPKSKNDPIYKFASANFTGMNFLVHPDILLFNAYKYDQREVAVYYALAALRNIAEYKATGNVTLNALHLPVAAEAINSNRLLSIKNGIVHFKYEEVNPKEIH